MTIILLINASAMQAFIRIIKYLIKLRIYNNLQNISFFFNSTQKQKIDLTLNYIHSHKSRSCSNFLAPATRTWGLV